MATTTLESAAQETLAPSLPSTPAAPTDARRGRGIAARLGRNSAIYAAANLLQKVIGFLLLPLYTHFLTPNDYGTFTVVVTLGTFLSVLLTLSLTASAQRFYFEYRDHPAELRAFWGTLLTFLLLVSLGASALLLLLGDGMLQPLLRDVPFWPLMALGIGAVVYQPFLDAFLAILQTQERAVTFFVLVISNIATKTLLAVALIAGLGLGVAGALSANLVGAGLFFAVSLVCLRGQVRVCLQRRYLGQALRYSLPLLPHTLAAQARLILDRMFLFQLHGAAASGIYNIGFQFGLLAHVLCFSVNRAFLPIFMSAMQAQDEAQLRELRGLGLGIVVVYCWASAAVAAFAPEAIALLTAQSYHGAYVVVPLLAFTFAAAGVYSLLAAVLFYYVHATKWVAAGTIGSLLLGALLNALLVPRLGLVGAAVAALVAQLAFTVVIGAVAHRYTKIHWPYARFAVLFIVGFAAGLVPLLASAPSWPVALLKAVGLVVLLAVLSVIAFGRVTLPRWRPA